MALSAPHVRFAPDDRPLPAPFNWLLAFGASAGLWALIGAALWWLAR